MGATIIQNLGQYAVNLFESVRQVGIAIFGG